MFNFEEGKVNFKSVEEVKEFLLSTENNNVFGAICFANSEGEVEREISVTEFIEHVGIDKVAQMIFDCSNNAVLVPIERDEIFEILEKAEKGEKLTEEEEKKLDILRIITGDNKDEIEHGRTALFNGITMTLAQLRDMALFGTVGGLLALMSTYLECSLVSSDEKLSRGFTNETTAEDITNMAVNKIHIDEDLSPEMALLGLLHKVGELSTSIPEIRGKALNLEDIADILDLDSEWIFNPEKRHENLANVLKEYFKQGSEVNSDGSNTKEFPEENKNGSNPENIVNIRDRLKRK